MSIMEIRENQSATSQSEVKKRALDALAQNVLDAANQIFPSIERPTTDHEELTVAELSNPTFNIKVICPRARVCDTSKQIRRSVRFQCYCDDAPHKSHLHYQFNNTVANVETLDLLQSTIWVCDHDANGQPYSSQTDWETLTGQSIVKPTKRATFVKSGHERTANDWLDDLDKLFRVMKPDRNDRYEKVKIAVIDSGLNDTVKRRYMTQNDIVYKDFCHETGNNSWHGTCCAKIIGDMYEEAKFSIARIFQEDHSNDSEGPIRMAKAIDWAISNSVDIISISAGFRDYSKELDEAVTRAKAAGTLVVAAAANWQNTGTVAFPARHNLTTMCIYSTNVGNQSSTFNPEPRSDTPNFAVLGEGFQHPDQKSEPMSGTSMSTAAAVGLAANIIDFARQSDNKSYIYRSQDVGKLPGMLSIFDAISKPAGSLRYVEPLNLLPGNKGYSRERGRQRVREILSQAMERAN
ncbi:hypothetical protein FGRA07_06355 [Fusarium graminearum]|nr:hypothetical protein FGRA07_06355 [Fusarium graminearum]